MTRVMMVLGALERMLPGDDQKGLLDLRIVTRDVRERLMEGLGFEEESGGLVG